MPFTIVSAFLTLGLAALTTAAPYNGTIAKRFGENCPNVVYGNLDKVPNGVDCGGQVLDSAWISDAGLSALNSLNEYFYPGNYPHDFNVDPAGYYTEIEAQCAESPRKHEEPIIVDGGRWYDLASSNPNADPGLYRLVSGFYAADTSDPCTAYLTYCGVVYHDEEDTNHLAPCTVIR